MPILVSGAGFLGGRWGTALRVRWSVRRYREAGADLREGDEVRVTGVVRAIDPPLRARLSGAPSVLWRTRVVFQPTNARGRASGQARRGDSDAVQPFALDRGPLGEIAIDAEGALLALPATPRRRFDRDACRMLLLECGGQLGDAARFEEIRLAPDARVTIIGTAMRDVVRGGDAGYREPATRFRLTGSPTRPLRILAR